VWPWMENVDYKVAFEPNFLKEALPSFEDGHGTCFHISGP
jgi:hypothetical protein